MNKKEKSVLIEEYLDEILPNAGCELTYTTDYGFLIAVMLSAQCTDKKVNKVTSKLFAQYDSLEKLANAKLEDIEEFVKPLGLYKAKAKNVIGIAQKLISDFNGVLPREKEKLVTLPGVGNKTANVVHCEIFKIPEFPVDTHVRRVSNRLALVNTDDVAKIEVELKKIFKKENWIKLHHQFIHFGRYYCKAMSPECLNCKLRSICKNK